MAKKKLTTQEILEAARAQAAQKSDDQAGEETSESEPTVETPAAKESAAVPQKPAAKAATPKSTKDILAAARAQTGGGTSKPTSTPKSTKDILAAARSQAGGEPAAASKPAEKPKSAAKTSPKAPSAAKPAGERPSVQEMLKAVREGKLAEQQPASTTQTSAKPTLPPRPQKPSPVKKRAPSGETTRRNVLLAILLAPLVLFSSAFATAWTMFAAASGAFILGMARFMMPNVLVEPPSKFKVGPPSDFTFGTVTTKFKAEFAVWLIHEEYQGRSLIYALSTVCTHLGCTPNWLEGEQKFKCPCHGSGFYRTGVNFEGPAPRPLERHGIRLAEDGMLEVDKSVKFQEEMGQWEDPASYVEVA